ncbi:MAG: M23 family metallopeptidase [Gammaproteobacteria bacterium]
MNRSGMPANGLSAKAPDGYEIFGRPVYAPCTGIVSAARNDAMDMQRPRRSSPLLGNYVAIDCKGVMVLLSHLQRGSVQFGAGDRVTVGEPIARVGDSGYSSEPHLQIHAQRFGATANADLPDADPVPVTFRAPPMHRFGGPVRLTSARKSSKTETEAMCVHCRRGERCARSSN